MDIPEVLEAKLIEMETLEIQTGGCSQEVAAKSAGMNVSRMLSLLGRALAATDLTATFRKEVGSGMLPDGNDAPDAEGTLGTWDLDAIRAANPGVEITPLPDGNGFHAETPTLKYPVSPPRPTQTATELLDHAQKAKTAIRAGKPYAWPEHLKVGGSLFNEGNPADDPAGDCCESDSGPVPPSDDEVVAMLPGLSRQDLEDKLRIIAAIVDQQPPFGTELADFRRRLRRML